MAGQRCWKCARRRENDEKLSNLANHCIRAKRDQLKVACVYVLRCVHTLLPILQSSPEDDIPLYWSRLRHNCFDRWSSEISENDMSPYTATVKKKKSACKLCNGTALSVVLRCAMRAPRTTRLRCVALPLIMTFGRACVRRINALMSDSRLIACEV